MPPLTLAYLRGNAPVAAGRRCSSVLAQCAQPLPHHGGSRPLALSRRSNLLSWAALQCTMHVRTLQRSGRALLMPCCILASSVSCARCRGATLSCSPLDAVAGKALVHALPCH